MVYINCDNENIIKVTDFLDLDESGDQLINVLTHRCLQCNEIVYEKEKNLWHCPECGFEWEVINCVQSL